MTYHIGFIGGGRMATAIADGLLKANPNIKIAVSDPLLQQNWGDRHCAVLNLKDLFESCQWLIWAVKPQIFKSETSTWSSLSFRGKGMISVMAGIPCTSIEKLFPKSPVIRTMPNTPMILGQGMVALAKGNLATEEQLKEVEGFFSPISKTLFVEESQLDGVTAISGSGPAYLFYLSEELIQRAPEMGLTPDQAMKLWAQTLRGAAAMLEGSTPPSELRQQVTSPGGTTQAALECFKKSHWDQIFGEGLKAAYHRSAELRQ
jgi:pyrroline-5-carboxylate reductase